MKWLEQLETYAGRLWSAWWCIDAWWPDEAPVRIEEPPFVPFDLSAIGAAKGADLPGANAAD